MSIGHSGGTGSHSEVYSTSLSPMFADSSLCEQQALIPLSLRPVRVAIEIQVGR